MGEKVVDQVVAASGLPEDSTRQRLEKLLSDGGFDPSQAGLEEIRSVLADLLQDLILATDFEN